AESGCIEKVIGNRIAMVASGPTPGRTPTSVPARTPTKQKKMFCQASATEKPRARFEMISINRLPQPIADQRQVDAKAEVEDAYAHGSDGKRKQSGTAKGHALYAHCSGEAQEQQRNQHAQRAHGCTEQDQADRKKDDGAPRH